MYVFDMKQVTLYNHQLINEITRDIICNYKPFYLVVLDTCIEQFNLVFSWGQLSQNAFVITELQCTSYMSHELTSL